MANEQTAEIKQEIIIRDFEEGIPSRHPGTFQLFYFKCDGFGFIVELYPNGISHANEGHVSVKISTTQCYGASLHCNLCVVDGEGNHLLLQSECCVNSYTRLSCIFERFLKHDTVLAQKEKLLPDDVLSMNCEIQCRYDVDCKARDLLPFSYFSVTQTFDEERGELNVETSTDPPQCLRLTEGTIKDMHREVTRDSDKRSVRIDDTDHRTLFELMLYAGSDSSFRPVEDTYTIHDSDYDRDTSDCVKYVIDIDDMSEHAPGLLGLAYMHTQHPLRCTVKRLIRHFVFQLAKELREIIGYSKMKTEEEVATGGIKRIKLSMEFIAIQRRSRMENWHELADVLKLYIAADECHVEALKEYCRKYFVSQMFIPDAIFVLMLADDYHDANLKATVSKIIREREREIMKLPTWDILTRSQPDLVGEIFAASSGEEIPADGFAGLKVSDDTPEIPKIFTAPNDGEEISKDVKI